MININIYIINLHIVGKSITLGWSKKEKTALKYANNILRNPNIEIFKVNINDYNDLSECPFNIDKQKFQAYLEKDMLVKVNEFVFTKEEWDILENDYNEYCESLRTSLETIEKVSSLLSDNSKKYFKSIQKELFDMNDKKLFKFFIKHHSLFNHDGSINSILERVTLRKTFEDCKKMDDEYKAICGIPHIPFDDRYF